MTDHASKRVTIEAPSGATILAARHLDATEGRAQVGATVDSATRGAITTVLRYIAKAHNSPAGDPQLDAAYRERAHLVALLAALYPAHIGYTDTAAIDWLVVTIETPTGQMSWHIAERDRDLFEHVRLVPAVHNVWDGHTTEQKYARLRTLTTTLAAPSPVAQYPDILRERAETHMHATTRPPLTCAHCHEPITGDTIREWTGPAGTPSRSWHADRPDCAAAGMADEELPSGWGSPDSPCAGFPDRCPNPVDFPARSPYHGGGIRCGCADTKEP